MNPELSPKFVAKPWGRDQLDARFGAPSGRIGEIWFEPPAELASLLVKYLFTSERLSVQVHPTGAQARAGNLGPTGKDECWLVVDALPGSKLGLGFSRSLDQSELRDACQSGQIADLLVWRDASPGDFLYVPANTVHAIGPGLVLLEVQQNSDVTFRLYDYGRSRQLHLDEGLAIARGEPYPDELHRHLPGRGELCLVEGPHFRLDRLEGPASAEVVERYRGKPLLVIPLSGEVVIGSAPVAPGSCGAAADFRQVRFSEGAQCIVAQPVD